MKKQLLALLLLGLTLSSPALAADPVETRKANFKQSGQILKAVRGQIAASDWQAIADGAQKIADWAEKIPEFFPASAPSRGASPAIWDNFDDFKSKAADNRNAALALKAAAESGDGDAIMGAVRTLGGTCKSCHSKYQAK